SPQTLGGPGRQGDHHPLPPRAVARPAIDHADDDLTLVGEIRNPNDGSEWIGGVSGDHRALIEGDGAWRPFSLESWSVVGRQALSHFENRTRRPRRGGWWRGPS